MDGRNRRVKIPHVPGKISPASLMASGIFPAELSYADNKKEDVQFSFLTRRHTVVMHITYLFLSSAIPRLVLGTSQQKTHPAPHVAETESRIYCSRSSITLMKVSFHEH